MSQRLVLVDDTNPNIQYSGPWFAVQNTQFVKDVGNFGPPFQNTLHGVNVSASFSFAFSGSTITVIGTSITTNASGTQDPTWECFIDNNSIGWRTVLQYAENNWIFCENDQLQDGPHVLSVKATISNRNTFWFDGLQYLPSSSISLDQSMLRVDSSDSAVQYSSGWQPAKDIVNLTQTAGSTVTYGFSGVSVSWVGFTPGQFPLNSSSATYSVDGQTPINFLVPALSSAGAIELYNQVLFTTKQLSAGQHKLVVTHQGNSGTAPLALDYFVVQGAPSPSTSSSNSNAPSTGVPHATTSSSIPSSSSSSNSTLGTGSTSSSTSTKQPLGAIIGGVLGGLVLLLLLLLLFLFIRRRNNRGARVPRSDKSYPDASYDIVDPFILPPPSNFSHLTPTLQSQIHTSEHRPLTPQPITSKFAQRRQLTDAPSTSPPTDASSSVSGGTMNVLRNHSFSSPAAISSPPSSGLSPANATVQTNPINSGVMSKAQRIQQPSASPQTGDARFVRHEDSGIRMPPSEDDIVELPPLYTPG